jgi:hypothetical protein
MAACVHLRRAKMGTFCQGESVAESMLSLLESARSVRQSGVTGAFWFGRAKVQRDIAGW